MHSSKISRVAVPAVIPVSAAIAADSETTLGYVPSKVRVYGILSQALKALEIRPLNRGDVETYKRSKAYRAPLTNKLKVLLSLFIFWATLPTVLALADVTTAWVWVTVGITFCVNAFIFASWAEDSQSTRVVRTWLSTEISRYTGEIPLHVLSKALQVKKAVPDATLWIEYLAQSKETYEAPRVLHDPFLRVERAKESYYIEVWDESEFERAVNYNIAI